MELSQLNAFLLVYFFILENDLNEQGDELKAIKFQSEEANTDEYLKKYFKDYILKNNYIQNTTLKELLIKIDGKERKINIDDLKSFKINAVYLPQELSSAQKNTIAKSKKSVYTNPDIYLEILENEEICHYKSIELKSTKTNKIPGSSIQQLAPFEWVIFVKRASNKVTIATGFYINCITENIPFPDRSPRPQIGFNILNKWNEKYRKKEKNMLVFESNTSFFDKKIKLLTDWQDYLASEWLKIVIETDIKQNEKWFNKALRKFASQFLSYMDELTEEERQKLKEQLQTRFK